LKRVLLGAATVALACAGMIPAQAAPAVYKVTGGGQTLIGETGAGNTIAFSAQSQGAEGTDAKGQFQYVDRTGGNGQDQVKAHGNVTCVVVYQGAEGMPATAVIGGETRDGEAFRIDVTDNGAGGDGVDDNILVRFGPDAEGDEAGLCDAEDQPEDDELLTLARGNVTIHKAKA
jgi:hypothetical protein